MVKILKTETDYRKALARVERIFDAKPNTPKGDELELMVTLIEKYEKEHHPVAPPTPAGAIRFRMEMAGLNQSDIARALGCSRSAISEILAGKRDLTLAMIRTLHEKFGIPLESLIGKSPTRARKSARPTRAPAARRGAMR